MYLACFFFSSISRVTIFFKWNQLLCVMYTFVEAYGFEWIEQYSEEF